MTTTWRLHTNTWPALSASEQRDYEVIVCSYGGRCDQEGRSEFRKYNAAEICAHTLEHRLGVRAQVNLSSRTRDH